MNVGYGLPTRANLDWITDRLATGGDLDWREDVALTQIEDMVAQGVTHVIDMRQEHSDEKLLLEVAPNIKYLHIPSDDKWGYRLPAENFDKGVDFYRQAKLEPGSKVLAHCHMGINRGPSMAMALLLDDGMDPVEAFNLIKAKRGIAGIAYATDALTAHLKRQKREGKLNCDPVKPLRALVKHIRKVNTGTEIGRINKIIRGLRAAEGGTEYV